MRPPLIYFDGSSDKEAYKKAKAEFNRLYRAIPIIDALGNEVIFPQSACHHVCFKEDEGDGGPKAKRDVWRPDRAAHIPWISTILTSPWEIRPNKVPGRLSYFLQYAADAAAGYPKESIYFAVVEPSERPKTVTFVTAYPVLVRRYWNEARQVGACLYPSEKVPTNKSKSKK